MASASLPTRASADLGDPIPLARKVGPSAAGTLDPVPSRGLRGGESTGEERWETRLPSAPTQRDSHTAVWTGTEMIIWGGFVYDNNVPLGYLSTGGRYNPATDAWIPMTSTGAPDGRVEHAVVWTGSEMIIWGGRVEGGSVLATGGRYSSVMDVWTPLHTTGAPSARAGHSAVWTGTEMIVWGGAVSLTGYLNNGGRYHPATDAWKGVATSGAPAPQRNDRLGRTSFDGSTVRFYPNPMVCFPPPWRCERERSLTGAPRRTGIPDPGIIAFRWFSMPVK